MKQSRRTFLKESSQLIAASSLIAGFPAILPARNGLAPSDQLNVGLIGCDGRGFSVLKSHLAIEGVNCVALCDVDENNLNGKGEILEREYQQKPKKYKDFRKLLEQKDVDAVIIGTPDHWHCLPMIYACEVGKDVYVEKPLANSIEECTLMVKAARRYNRIVQVGQQQRSSEVWKSAVDYLKSGKLGHIRKTNIWANFNYGLGPKKSIDGPVPSGVDYDFWLGPAPSKAFNPARFHGSWRFFWDYGGGLMTDWGVHLIDMALWVKDITTPPKSVVAYGTKLPNPNRMTETYETMTAIFPYEDENYTIQWENNAGVQVGPYDNLYGVAFIGENGTLVADRGSWEVFPEWDNEKKVHKIEKGESFKGKHGHQFHPINFVESIKERKEPACPIELGRTVAVCAHMANIAVRTNENYLEWDEEKGKFTNSREANKLIKPAYRKPWTLPKL